MKLEDSIMNNGICAADFADELNDALFLQDVQRELDRAAEAVVRDADAMVGTSDFPALLRSLQRMLRAGEDRTSLERVFYRRAYLFFADRGRGYNHALKLFARFLYAEGALGAAKWPPLPEITELRCDANTGLQPVKPAAARDGSGEDDRLLSVDLTDVSETLDEPRIQSALLRLRENVRERRNVVVFRLPYMTGEKAVRVMQAIGRYYTVEPVFFAPLTDANVWEMAELFFRELGWHPTPSAADAFAELVRYTKDSGAFYGSHTVRKLVDDVIMARLSAPDYDGNQLLDAETIRASLRFPERYRLDRADRQTFEEAMAEMDGMTGMEEVRRNVEDIIRGRLFAKRTGAEQPAMHMVLTGNPGTGKTTVARIIARALKASGLLPVGRLIECSSTDMIGQYVGHTAQKTREQCRAAYGSVLFIDEAYMLAGSQGFGKEAIAELIAQMENHRDEFIVILAGYAKEMKEMLETNPGMKRRVPYQIDIPNCDAQQLTAIFFRLLRAKTKRCGETEDAVRITFSEDFEAHVAEFFRSIPAEVLASRTFGNGGYARDLMDRTLISAQRRCLADASDGTDELKLEAQDFDYAAARVTAY